MLQVADLKSRQQGIGAGRRADGITTAANDAGEAKAALTPHVMEASDDAESAVQPPGIVEALGASSLESACSSGWDVLRQNVLGKDSNSIRHSIIL